MNAVNYIKRQPKPVFVALAVVLVVVLGAVDWLTGPELAFSIFYLIPICFSVWFAGKRAGLVIALLSAVAWLVDDLLWRQWPTHPLIPYWNAAVRLGFFVAITFLLSELKAMKEMLEKKVEERTTALTAENAERNRAEEQVRASEQRFRQLAEAIHEVFWLTNPEKSEMIYISPGYEKIWGRSRDSLRVAPRSWLDAVHPEDRERVQQAAMTKQGSGDYDEEYRIVRSDGSVRWIRDRAFPVRDAAGNIYRIAGIAEDITERKEAEARLATLAHGLESTTELICITDLQDRFTFVNRAFLQAFGYTEQEILGETPDILFSPKNPPSLMVEVLEQSHVSGWHGEVLDRRKDGTEFPVSLSTSQIKDRSGNVIGLLGVSRDITERKQLEKEILEISDREQSRIGQDLHDSLCQDLASIAYAAGLLEEKLREKLTPEAAHVAEIGDLINRAVVQARELARVLFPVKLEAEGLASALHDLAANVTKRTAIACTVNCPELLPMVDTAVSIHLFRIAQEAVANAVKHARPRHIWIQLDVKADTVALTVRDDGCGIAVPLAPSRGMGLNIMRYRARMIGGTLEVSRGSQEGTIVACSFQQKT